MTNDRIPEALLLSDEKDRLDLDHGNYATRTKGIVRLFTKDNREIFAVDANLFPLDYKILNGALQIYLLGFQNGRTQERANCKQRIQSALNLALET